MNNPILDATIYVHDAPRLYQLNNFMARVQQKVMGKQQSAQRRRDILSHERDTNPVTRNCVAGPLITLLSDNTLLITDHRPVH